MNKTVFFLVPMLFVSSLAGAEPPQSGIAERYSYAMGVRLGQLLKGQGVSELDSRAFASAIDDVLNGHPLRYSDVEMRQAMVEQRQRFAEQRAERAQANLQAGQRFLAENAGKPEIVVLPSGLQYKVLANGEGAQPATADTVRVHYHGVLIDGSVFDSSVERGQPAEFPLAGVVPGFREALSLMRVGDHWRVFMPSGLAYGERGAGADIGPNETLIFDIQLLDIVR